MEVRAPARQRVVEPSILLHGLYNLIQLIPADYNFLFEDVGTKCPKSKYDALHAHISASSFKHITHGEPTLSDKLDVLSLGMLLADCTTTYLRPDQPNSHSWDFY